MRSKDVDIDSTSNGHLKSTSFINAINHAILYEAANIGINELCLANIKHNLNSLCEYNGFALTILEKYTVFALLGGGEDHLSFNKNGDVLDSISDSLFITIDVRDVINTYFPSLLTSIEQKSWKLLTDREQRILEIIKNPRFHSVKLIKKGNQLQRAECEEKLPVTTRVIDIIREAPFQNIEIKQEAGKPVYINRIVKSKI